jgi:hypothetical protein
MVGRCDAHSDYLEGPAAAIGLALLSASSSPICGGALLCDYLASIGGAGREVAGWLAAKGLSGEDYDA